jgi:hypothetical protein
MLDLDSGIVLYSLRPFRLWAQSQLPMLKVLSGKKSYTKLLFRDENSSPAESYKSQFPKISLLYLFQSGKINLSLVFTRPIFNNAIHTDLFRYIYRYLKIYFLFIFPILRNFSKRRLTSALGACQTLQTQ